MILIMMTMIVMMRYTYTYTELQCILLHFAQEPFVLYAYIRNHVACDTSHRAVHVELDSGAVIQ
jgi:hypothetical protein